MSSSINKNRSTVRSKTRSRKAKTMTKAEMIQKMLADQKIIREAREKGISYKELEKKYGFKFARLPHIQD